ncbi:MAG TPA: response regulator FixJ [Woeseiaceae bacterium]|nr:response regulator FixJ [Woeseiaceae bacterium]
MTSDSQQEPTVFVVDDDEQIRKAMRFLLASAGLKAEAYASGSEFLESFDPSRPGCLVLDIRMPGLGGLELQERLAETGSGLPIIFVTGHADVPMAVEAMQKGAFDFVQKPFRDEELLERINAALARDREVRSTQAARADIARRLETLTAREREVMELVVTGKPNKVIAWELGVSQRTVEIHRARVMEKMKARSLAELVRMTL